MQGEVLEVENPSKLPPADKIERIEEPYVRGSIFVPTEFMTRSAAPPGKAGRAQVTRIRRQTGAHPVRLPAERDRRGLLRPAQVHLQGYASFDYDFLEFRASDLVKLDVLMNGLPVDAFSIIVHHERLPEGHGPHQAPDRDPPAALRDRDPGGHRLARDRAETVKALRKNVTAKCYGGDISRKRKLLEKQKEGEKR